MFIIFNLFLQTVYEDNLSGASTVLFTFIIDRGITWEVCKFFSIQIIMSCLKVPVCNLA